MEKNGWDVIDKSIQIEKEEIEEDGEITLKEVKIKEITLERIKAARVNF